LGEDLTRTKKNHNYQESTQKLFRISINTYWYGKMLLCHITSLIHGRRRRMAPPMHVKTF